MVLPLQSSNDKLDGTLFTKEEVELISKTCTVRLECC